MKINKNACLLCHKKEKIALISLIWESLYKWNLKQLGRYFKFSIFYFQNIHLSIYPLIHPCSSIIHSHSYIHSCSSICAHPSIYVHAHPSIHSPIHLCSSIHPFMFIHPSMFVFMFIHLSIYLSTHLSICVHPSIYPLRPLVLSRAVGCWSLSQCLKPLAGKLTTSELASPSQNPIIHSIKRISTEHNITIKETSFQFVF